MSLIKNSKLAHYKLTILIGAQTHFLLILLLFYLTVKGHGVREEDSAYESATRPEPHLYRRPRDPLSFQSFSGPALPNVIWVVSAGIRTIGAWMSQSGEVAVRFEASSVRPCSGIYRAVASRSNLNPAAYVRKLVLSAIAHPLVTLGEDRNVQRDVLSCFPSRLILINTGPVPIMFSSGILRRPDF